MGDLLIDVGLLANVSDEWVFELPGAKVTHEALPSGREWALVRPMPPEAVQPKVVFDRLQVSNIRVVATLKVNAIAPSTSTFAFISTFASTFAFTSTFPFPSTSTSTSTFPFPFAFPSTSPFPFPSPFLR